MAGIVIYLLLSVIAGIFVCFYGRRLFFPALGAILCFFSVAFCLSRFGASLQTGLIAVAVCAVAIFTLKYLFKAGVFLAGAFFGTMLGALLSAALPQTGNLAWVIILLFALLCGFCSVKWIGLFLIISTGSSGAGILAVSAGFLVLKFRALGSFVYVDGALSTMTHLHEYLYRDFSVQNPLLILGLTVVFAVVGISVQLHAPTNIE